MMFPLLHSGLLVTVSVAANNICPPYSFNETVLCANANSTITNIADACEWTFEEYACTPEANLDEFTSDLLLNLTACPSSVMSNDSLYSILFFSKLNSSNADIMLSNLTGQFQNVSKEWKNFFLAGIWPSILQKVNSSNPAPQLIPIHVGPFLPYLSASMMQCLVDKKAPCENIQELVQGIGIEDPGMTITNGKELFPVLKSLLQNSSGNACSNNVNSSNWLAKYFGKFAQFADYKDFIDLNPNFNALDVLPSLTVPQIVNFCLQPNAVNNSNAAGQIMGILNSSADVQNFLTNLNLAANNMSSIPRPLAQGLINKTFQVLIPSLSPSNSSDWAGLFQDNLKFVLPEITTDQLKFLPSNFSCDSFQVVMKAMDSSSNQLKNVKPEDVYKAVIQPYLKNNGLSCSQNVNTSTWVTQNLGKFMQFAEYKDLLAFNAHFNALDVLSSLTVPQVVSFSLESNASSNTNAAGQIMALFPNAADVQNFLVTLNSAAALNNMSSIPRPLAQGLINKTFQVLIPSLSPSNSSDWAGLFQDNLKFVLPEITTDQLKFLPSNFSCDSFQAVMKAMDSSFNQLKNVKQEDVYKVIIQPNLKNNGLSCSQNVNTSTWVTQNLGKFMQFAEYKDLLAFNAHFNALDVLSNLTVPQVVSFSLESNASSNTNAAGQIMALFPNAADVQNFLVTLNSAAALKNMSAIHGPLALDLINKTLQLLIPSLSPSNSSGWTGLFQDKLKFILPEITTDQLKLLPQTFSCDSFQSVIKAMDTSFSHLKNVKQEDVYKVVIQPYLKNNGSVCSKNVNSSTWINGNFGKYSQFAEYKDLVAFNPNFNGMDVLSSLTVPQVVSLSLESSAGSNPSAVGQIMALLQNTNNAYDFLAQISSAAASKNMTTVPIPLAQGLLNKTFQTLTPKINNFNSSDWSTLFNNLSLVLPEISQDQLSLIPQNISCDSFQVVTKRLNSVYQQMKPEKQQAAYGSFIKPYLKNNGQAPKCYNQSDPNSAGWLLDNMGFFFALSSQTDLLTFANQNTLQLFVNNPATSQFASQLNLDKDIAIFITTLMTSGGNTNFSSIPSNFLCFLTPQAFLNMNSADIFDISQKINKACAKNQTQGASAQTTEELQVSISLVSKLNNFTSSTLSDLGQTAVGLSTSQISSIKDSDLKGALSSLSSVSGWSSGQSKAIMNKLFQSGYQVTNLESLGSLVVGLPSKKLMDLDPGLIVNASKNSQFANQLSSAPSSLQTVFVAKILSADSKPENFVKMIPNAMAVLIPKSRLAFKPILDDINNKAWAPEQAAMFFDSVVPAQSVLSNISASVLQGYTCGSNNKMSPTQVQSLAKAMKINNAILSEDQLNCLAKPIVKISSDADMESYPREIYLFSSPPSNANTTACKAFYTNVGAANISILSADSKKQKNFLPKALSCLNVTGFALTSDQIQILGQLVCDLNGTYIENSDSSVINQLPQCTSLTDDQKTSIIKVISQGKSSYGQPSTWSKTTLKSLKGIMSFANNEILSNISNDVLVSWIKDTSDLKRSQLATIVKTLYPNRARRAAGCTTGQITADNIKDNSLPLTYPTEQLNACLNDTILKDFLQDLGNKPFTNGQLGVLKTRLDTLYPSGYPEEVIPNLGAIAGVCAEADIAKWNITSVDTLESLLKNDLSSNVVKAVIDKFISGNSLSTSALNVIGSPSICLLNSSQLNGITPSAIGDAKPLNVNPCNQTVKDQLYVKANTSFQSMISDSSAYFTLKKPYIGGAPATDLQYLASKSVSMDIGTFISLNVNSVLGLSVGDVKGLLGSNVADLKTQENNTVVNTWARSQSQSALDLLGIGLTGGRADATTSTTVSQTTKKVGSSAVAVALSHSLLITGLIAFLLS
ncbi:hypothetical protein XELAEV_18047781mg [Xenopus laevis]|uniref:Mesothelin-like protein n=1 Tax=Xenopus laevis TaxID=8355 RepID=A0A974BW44_XENLA|nr:hypothetical protein XELAEV_18047781mg [Xenopus laevis]